MCQIKDIIDMNFNQIIRWNEKWSKKPPIKMREKENKQNMKKREKIQIIEKKKIKQF